MATSDLDMLIDMGFDRERAEMAIKQSGGLQGAIDWLDTNQEMSLDEIKAASAAPDNEQEPELKPGEEARSLVCEDCGKKLRSHAQAEFHASKTGHENFAESTEEVAPLTEDEKKAKLNDLRERLSAKRGEQSQQDKIDKKRNEEIRKKSTKEQQDAKEDLQKKERLKEAQASKREKLAEIEAKRRIQARIAEDKEERRLKAEKEKAQRMGQTFPTGPMKETMSAADIPTKKPANAYTEARLRLQTDEGSIQKNFPAETTLFEVAHVITEEKGIAVVSFTTNFPKKVFETTDFGMTLKEAGFVPSAALIVK